MLELSDLTHLISKKTKKLDCKTKSSAGGGELLQLGPDCKRIETENLDTCITRREQEVRKKIKDKAKQDKDRRPNKNDKERRTYEKART